MIIFSLVYVTIFQEINTSVVNLAGKKSIHQKYPYYHHVYSTITVFLSKIIRFILLWNRARII